eukprot:5042237-Pleurochrysis_carterae.AAC.2
MAGASIACMHHVARLTSRVRKRNSESSRLSNVRGATLHQRVGEQCVCVLTTTCMCASMFAGEARTHSIGACVAASGVLRAYRHDGPVVEDAEAEGLPLRVRAQIRLEAERVDHRNIGLHRKSKQQEAAAANGGGANKASVPRTGVLHASLSALPRRAVGADRVAGSAKVCATHTHSKDGETCDRCKTTAPLRMHVRKPSFDQNRPCSHSTAGQKLSISQARYNLHGKQKLCTRAPFLLGRGVSARLDLMDRRPWPRPLRGDVAAPPREDGVDGRDAVDRARNVDEEHLRERATQGARGSQLLQTCVPDDARPQDEAQALCETLEGLWQAQCRDVDVTRACACMHVRGGAVTAAWVASGRAAPHRLHQPGRGHQEGGVGDAARRRDDLAAAAARHEARTSVLREDSLRGHTEEHALDSCTHQYGPTQSGEIGSGLR